MKVSATLIAILFLASMLSMVFNIQTLEAATEEETELTITNPEGCTVFGSIVYWTFEIIEPDKMASQGETVYFRMRITNLPESDAPLQLSGAGVTFNPGLPLAYGNWYFDLEWPTVHVGETYEGPFGHLSWTTAVPIGYIQGGGMGVNVYYGSPDHIGVPYSVTIDTAHVYVDIKPGSWPNPLNTKSNGLLTVAVCGTEDFDVTEIDPTSIRLSLEDNLLTFMDEVSPIRWSYEDVATPYIMDADGGHDLEGDGYLDLVLKFKIQELVEADLSSYTSGEMVVIILTGNLMEDFDGTPIHGMDFVMVLSRAREKIELSYDDGTSEVGVAWNVAGGMFAVKFTPPIYPVKILEARVFFHALNNPSDPIRIHILDEDFNDLTEAIDLTVYQEQAQTWISVDVSSRNIILTSGDFFIASEQLVAGDPDIGSDTSSPPQNRSWEFNLVLWYQSNWTNYMIRAVVSEVKREPVARARE